MLLQCCVHHLDMVIPVLAIQASAIQASDTPVFTRNEKQLRLFFFIRKKENHDERENSV